MVLILMIANCFIAAGMWANYASVDDARSLFAAVFCTAMALLAIINATRAGVI